MEYNQQINEQSAQTSQELIEMAANQSINEEASNNGGVEVVKKVNINFGGLKLTDSKKRGRAALGH